MCGTGWYGNVFVNKCYRYIPQAMTFTFARDTCMQEGGRLAVVDSNFLRRFILTSVTLARYTSNIQSMFMIKIDTGGILYNDNKYKTSFSISFKYLARNRQL